MAVFPTLVVTSPHKKSKSVEDAQWLLGHNRWNQVWYNEKVDGEYGPYTGSAAHQAKFYLGYPDKQVNNAFGPLLYSYLVPKGHPAYKELPVTYKTRKAARAKVSNTLQSRAINEAKKHIGYMEKPTNLTIFGEWYHGNGFPWCAVFVSYCINMAGGTFRQTYCPYILANARSSLNGTWVTTKPQHGFIVLYDWQNDNTFDHVGFFDEWISEAAGTFKTVEGNTLPEGGTGNQSNGGGVYARKRGIKAGYNAVFVGYNK